MLNPQIAFDVDASEIGLVPGQFPNCLDVLHVSGDTVLLTRRPWFLDEWRWTPSGDLMYVIYRHAEDTPFRLHVWND
jgi:hypothetical protein